MAIRWLSRGHCADAKTYRMIGVGRGVAWRTIKSLFVPSGSGLSLPVVWLLVELSRHKSDLAGLLSWLQMQMRSMTAWLALFANRASWRLVFAFGFLYESGPSVDGWINLSGFEFPDDRDTGSWISSLPRRFFCFSNDVITAVQQACQQFSKVHGTEDH